MESGAKRIRQQHRRPIASFLDERAVAPSTTDFETVAKFGYGAGFCCCLEFFFFMDFCGPFLGGSFVDQLEVPVLFFPSTDCVDSLVSCSSGSVCATRVLLLLFLLPQACRANSRGFKATAPLG